MNQMLPNWTAYEPCPSCGGSGLSSNCYTGEPEACPECRGDTVVRARDERGRFTKRPLDDWRPGDDDRANFEATQL